MRILLQKISDTTHRLRLVRDDGDSESIELVSRSFLLHDLLHYAVETNAKLDQSFWGRLAGGMTLAQLHEASRKRGCGGAPMPAEAAITEAIVGVLTNVVAERATARAAIEGLARLFEVQERQVPTWFTADFVQRVEQHMKKLRGEWRALPYGGEMQLIFPIPADQEAKQAAKSPPRMPGRAGVRLGPLTSSRHR
ncbi:MAG TPA: hypothetical protein VIY51_12705 [Xanthobacteraceae bacterium]